MNNSISLYDNILALPQGLQQFDEITLCGSANGSSIYFKSLNESLTNIEFCTNQFCLLYVQKGGETLTSWQNKSMFVCQGQFIMLIPGENIHSDFVKISEQLEAWLFFFDTNHIESLTLRSDYIKEASSTEHWQPFSHQLIQQYFNQINEYKKANIDLTPMLDSKFKELISLLIQIQEIPFLESINSIHSKTQCRRNLQRLMVERDILRLSMNEIASLSGRTLSTFKRDFKRIFGESAQQWIINKKLDLAKQELLNSQTSVTQIAFDLGYNNVSHFIKTYKAQYGSTPKQQRLQINQN